MGYWNKAFLVFAEKQPSWHFYGLRSDGIAAGTTFARHQPAAGRPHAAKREWKALEGRARPAQEIPHDWQVIGIDLGRINVSLMS